MTHINQRRDLASNWSAVNPVLHEGEVGWERDTRKAKLGDGTTAWNALPYVVEGEVTSVNGRSGAVVLDAADVGLGDVDNTPDANKPVSAAQQAAIDDAVVAAVTQAVAQAVAEAKLAAHPVGSIYIGVTSANPATLLGGGTWVAWGAGRVPVGFNGADADFNAPEKTGGSKTKTLTQANLPSHAHTMNHGHAGVKNNSAGASTTTFQAGVNDGNNVNTGTNAPILNFTGSTGTTGSGTAFNVMNAYITAYMWKRTA